MTQDTQYQPAQPATSHTAWFKRPAGVAGAMAAMIVAFYLLREHWYHIAGYWSYLLLLACPLMHLFHGGHHGHGGHTHTPDKSGKEHG